MIKNFFLAWGKKWGRKQQKKTNTHASVYTRKNVKKIIPLSLGAPQIAQL